MRYAVQRAQFSESQGLRIVGVNPRVRQGKAFTALYEAVMDGVKHMDRGGLVEMSRFAAHHCDMTLQDQTGCPDLTAHVYMLRWAEEHPTRFIETYRLVEAS